MPDREPVTRREIAAWYNHRYASRQHKAYRPYEAYVHFLDSAQVAFRPGARLLDVGSGQGYLLKAAAARGLSATGVDLSFQAVNVSKQAAPGADGVTAVGESLPFRAGTFDYLTCMGSLEHHLDIRAALGEFIRVTTPDAKIVLAVPNRDFLGYVLLRQKGTAQQAIKETLLSLSQWQALFEEAGLDILRVGTDDWFLRAPLDFSRGVRNIGRQVLRKAILTMSPFNRTYAFIFVCQKK